jgi:hypothetical protein
MNYVHHAVFFIVLDMNTASTTHPLIPYIPAVYIVVSFAKLNAS